MSATGLAGRTAIVTGASRGIGLAAEVARSGTPEDVAAAVAYLVGAEAGFVSGQMLYLAGGPTI
jgi:3-oxoacyl-[acyl-carrier protein] reductase